MRMAVWTLSLGCWLGGAFPLRAQTPSDPFFERASPFATYRVFKDSLEAVAATEDPGRLDAFWRILKEANQIPFVVGDSVAFLYRGPATSVAWNGDFNGWSQDASFRNEGVRVEGTDLWMLEQTFPADARLDYKIVVNGDRWMLDPANPLQQWSGFGPNSELRMPAWEYPLETIPRSDGPHGTLSDDKLISSTNLRYDVRYRVYTPAGYDALSNLPVLYVTDGHEYAADHKGSMKIVLDNLIADGRIQPVLVVFVDPREPGNPSNNRRQSQYADDYAPFAAFLADELVPVVDGAFKTEPSAEERGILGTSLGGLFSAYLGAARPDVFRRIGIHSPAFFYDTRQNQDRIYRMYTESDRLPLDIFMSNGTYHDLAEGAHRMKAVFEEKGYPLHYIEVNEGHSWGNWRALLDAPLIVFWGTGESTGVGEE